MESACTLGCRVEGGTGWTTAQSRNPGQFTCKSKSPWKTQPVLETSKQRGEILVSPYSPPCHRLPASPSWQTPAAARRRGQSECSRAEQGPCRGPEGRRNQAQIAAVSVSMMYSELLKNRDLISLAFVITAPSTK